MTNGLDKCPLGTTLGVLLVLFFAATLIVYVTHVMQKKCVARLSRGSRESFVNDYGENDSVMVRPANDVFMYKSSLGFGAELLPLKESGSDVQIRRIQNRDRVKFEALRPYIPHLDENRGSAHDQIDVSREGDRGGALFRYTYHIEIPPRAFRCILEKISVKEETDVHDERGLWEFQEIGVDRLPREVYYGCKEYYEKRLNDIALKCFTAKIIGPAASYDSNNPFKITVMAMDSAETGILVSGTEMSIFDRFKLGFRACFHRSGKSVGHCARLTCQIDISGKEPIVYTDSVNYIGILPESFAADSMVNLSVK